MKRLFLIIPAVVLIGVLILDSRDVGYMGDVGAKRNKKET